MLCACCGAIFNPPEGAVLVSATLNMFKLCTPCVDWLWEHRNPAMLQRDEEGLLDVEESAL
jgi:hypothetical protein